MTKTKRKTKPVPLNKMTRKALLKELRKVKGKAAAEATELRATIQRASTAATNAIDELASDMQRLRTERDDFRQSLNGALEEIAALKGKLAVQALI